MQHGVTTMQYHVTLIERISTRKAFGGNHFSEMRLYYARELRASRLKGYRVRLP